MVSQFPVWIMKAYKGSEVLQELYKNKMGWNMVEKQFWWQTRHLEDEDNAKSFWWHGLDYQQEFVLSGSRVVL